MTVAQLRAALTAAGIAFDPSMNKAQLQALLDGATNAPATPSIVNVSGLFSAAPIRLEQASFADVEIGMQAVATLSSFRRSREGSFWIGTFAFPNGVGNVTAIVGETGQTTMSEMLALKSHAVTLRYNGSNTITGANNTMVELPSFNVNF